MSLTLEITGLAHGGHGVARSGREVWFIPYALPGDTVVAREVRRARGVVWGNIESVVVASPHRTAAPCPVFGRCGGCTWLHFTYPAQLEWKRTIVAETFKRIGRIEVGDIGMVEDSSLRLGYRTRAEFHGGGKVRGFYALGTHEVVDVPSCALCHPRLNAALDTLRQHNVNGSVEITVNPEGDDVLAWSARPNPKLLQLYPAAQCMRSASPRAQFEFDGVPIVCGAFSQGSLLLNRMLRAHVSGLVGDAKTVLDLYCGAGNLSLGLNAEVVGVDHNRAATSAAVAMKQGDYRSGDEADFSRAIAERSWDVILLDPPREGAKAIVPALAASAARGIVYVSCDPATLARDAMALAAGGWSVCEIAVVDMFPHTAHIEAVCRFERV